MGTWLLNGVKSVDVDSQCLYDSCLYIDDVWEGQGGYHILTEVWRRSRRLPVLPHPGSNDQRRVGTSGGHLTWRVEPGDWSSSYGVEVVDGPCGGGGGGGGDRRAAVGRWQSAGGREKVQQQRPTHSLSHWRLDGLETFQLKLPILRTSSHYIRHSRHPDCATQTGKITPRKQLTFKPKLPP